MEKQTIKLRPKQLEALSQIQNQKAQINQMLQKLNENESLIITLIFEEKGVNISTINDIKLEQDSLIYQVNEPKPKKSNKKAAA